MLFIFQLSIDCNICKCSTLLSVGRILDKEILYCQIIRLH